jgi:hypothetical protein
VPVSYRTRSSDCDVSDASALVMEGVCSVNVPGVDSMFSLSSGFQSKASSVPDCVIADDCGDWAERGAVGREVKLEFNVAAECGLLDMVPVFVLSGVPEEAGNVQGLS